VQEAKEIPTVKVLDAAIVPTKKSFPPRSVIVLMGTMLGITLGMTWILGKTRWDAVDVSDPRRVFATEVFTTVQARMPKFSRNGASAESNGHRTWSWRKKSDATGEEQDKNHE
jgi:hypothetical protein